MGMINLDGRNDPDNPVYASMFSIPLPIETFALGYYVMVRTGDRAEIAYNRAKNSIAISWPDGYTDHLREKAQLVFDKVTQANGVDYRDDLFEGKAFAPNTVHPMGGVFGAGPPTPTAGSRGTTSSMSTTRHCFPAIWAATRSCPSPRSRNGTSKESCGKQVN